MKKNIFLQSVLVILFSVVFNSLSAQKTSDKVKSEITRTLELWNTAAKTANLEQSMAMFDCSDDVR